MRLALFAISTVLFGAEAVASEAVKRLLVADLAVPVQVQATGVPLDVEREGHSARRWAISMATDCAILVVCRRASAIAEMWARIRVRGSEGFTGLLLEAGGSVQEGCCIGFVPQLVDLDRDGRTDIVSGSWPGEIYLFRRASDGNFLARQPLPGPDGKPINVGPRGSAFVVDWDASGTLDLLVAICASLSLRRTDRGRPYSVVASHLRRQLTH
jgi:hypothetical protein